MPRAALPYLLDTTGGREVIALRAHAESDVARVVEQCRDPLSIRWTTAPDPFGTEDAVRFVREVMPGGWESDQEWGFAVDVDGRFGGTVSLRNENAGRAEIAYGAHPDVRGTGAMERALRLLLEWGFAEHGLSTVIWWANRGNWASRRLAWRLGFDIGTTPVRAWLDHRDALVDAWVGTLLAGDARTPRNRWLDAPVIESDRLPLRLRALRESDVRRLVEGVSDPVTATWLGGIEAGYSVDSARESLLRTAEHAAAGSGLVLGVAARDDDRLLGRVDLSDVGWVRSDAEIGYWVHPDERFRGVATEATRLLARHALLPVEDGGLGLVRLRAHSAVDNVASRAVLARTGFTEVGVERWGTRVRAGLADAVLVELVRDP